MRGPTQLDVLRDLADTAERFLALVSAECLHQPGYESSCQCDTHQQVRLAADELQLVIKAVRGA